MYNRFVDEVLDELWEKNAAGFEFDEFNSTSDIESIRSSLDYPIVRDPYDDETLPEYLAWHDDGPNNFGSVFSATELTKLHKPFKTPCTISPKKLPTNEVPPRKYWPRIIPTRHLAGFLRQRMGVPLKVGHAWRPPWYNDHVCGEDASQHQKFAAMDIDLLSEFKTNSIKRKFYEEAVKIYTAVGPWFEMGLGLYSNAGYGSRVHIDTGWRMRTWKAGYAQKVAQRLGLTLPSK